MNKQITLKTRHSDIGQLYFILSEFINTHDYEGNIYAKEIKAAIHILNQLSEIPNE